MWRTTGLLLFMTPVSLLQADWHPVAVGVGLAYTADAHESLAVEAGVTVTDDWQIRGRLEHGLYNRKHTVSLVRFDESFERNSLGIFADKKVNARPGLLISAGVVHFDHASAWTAHPENSAVYELNGRYYSGLNLGQPEATVSYNTLVPYIGLGWVTNPAGNKGWEIRADIGTLFRLNPQLRIHSDNPSNLPLLNQDLQAEADAYVERLRQDNRFLGNTAIRAGITASYHF